MRYLIEKIEAEIILHISNAVEDMHLTNLKAFIAVRGRSGIRGHVETSLTPEEVEAYHVLERQIINRVIDEVKQ